MDKRLLLLALIAVALGGTYYVSTAASQIEATIIPESNIGIQDYNTIYTVPSTIFKQATTGAYMDGWIPKFVYDAGNYVLVGGLYKDNGTTPFDTKVAVISKDGQVINETVIPTPYTYYGYFDVYNGKTILFMGDWTKLLVTITDGQNLETYRFQLDYNTKPYVLSYNWGDYNGQEGLYVLILDPNDYSAKVYFIPYSDLPSLSGQSMYNIINNGQAQLVTTIGNIQMDDTYQRFTYPLITKDYMEGILTAYKNSTEYHLYVIEYNVNTGSYDILDLKDKITNAPYGAYAWVLYFGQQSIDQSILNIYYGNSILLVTTPSGLRYTISDNLNVGAFTYAILYYNNTLYYISKYVPPADSTEQGTIIYNGTPYTVNCPYRSSSLNETPLIIISKVPVTENGRELTYDINNRQLLAIDSLSFDSMADYYPYDIQVGAIPTLYTLNTHKVLFLAVENLYAKQITVDASSYSDLFDTGSTVPARDIVAKYYIVAYDLSTDTFQKTYMGQTTSVYISCNRVTTPRIFISVIPGLTPTRYSNIPIMQAYNYIGATVYSTTYQYEYITNYDYTELLSPVVSQQEEQPTPQPARVTTVKITPVQYPPQEQAQPSQETGYIPPTGVQATVPASPSVITTIVVLSVIAAWALYSLMRRKA